MNKPAISFTFEDKLKLSWLVLVALLAIITTYLSPYFMPYWDTQLALSEPVFKDPLALTPGLGADLLRMLGSKLGPYLGADLAPYLTPLASGSNSFWTLWSAHLVHASSMHLVGNLSWFALGAYLLWPWARAHHLIWDTLAGAPLLCALIGLYLWWSPPLRGFQPIISYQGLSGLLSLYLAAACIRQIKNPNLRQLSKPAWVLLALWLIKLSWDLLAELSGALPIWSTTDQVQGWGASHLLGAMAGLITGGFSLAFETVLQRLPFQAKEAITRLKP